MKEFLKPKSVKIIITILLLLIFLWVQLHTFTLGLTSLCLPSISGSLSVPTPTPTPQNLNIKDTVTDFSIMIVSQGIKPCYSSDPSYQAATTIYNTISPLLILLIDIMFSYFISCIIFFCITRLKKQKKNYTVKLKK